MIQVVYAMFYLICSSAMVNRGGDEPGLTHFTLSPPVSQSCMRVCQSEHGHDWSIE